MAIDVLGELFAHLGEDLFVASFAHGTVREVCVHARTVPVGVTERLRVVVDCKAVLFAGALEEVTGKPDLVASTLCALCEDLELPLTCGDLTVDSLNVETCIEADIEMLFDHVAAECVLSADRAVVRALWFWVTGSRESWWTVGDWIPQEVLLLETKPEVFVIIGFVDGRTPVGRVWSAVRVKNLGHDEVCVPTVRIGDDRDWLQQKVGGATVGLVR